MGCVVRVSDLTRLCASVGPDVNFFPCVLEALHLEAPLRYAETFTEIVPWVQ